MARTSMKKTPSVSHDKGKATPRAKGLAKRVQFGARVSPSEAEFALLVEFFIAHGGKPKTEDIEKMSKQIDRCPKQLSIWLSNRRQGLRDARVKNGAVFKTDDDKREFLWSKYRSASKKASKTPEAASTPADTSMESGSELTRASSVETAQYSTSEATTPFEYDSKSISSLPSHNAQPTPRASKFDFLLHAVNLATVEVEQNDEICQALLGLRCA